MAVQSGCLSIPLEEGEVSCLSFSPHQDSDDLLAVGTSSKMVIKSCRIKVMEYYLNLSLPCADFCTTTCIKLIFSANMVWG